MAFVGTIYFTAVWLKFGKPVFGTPARWRLTTWLAWFVVVPMLCLAFVLNSQHHSLGNLLDDHSFVIPPEWSVREPILLARVETHSPLTPWLGAGFLEVRNGAPDDFLALSPGPLYTPQADSSSTQQQDAMDLAPTIVSSAWKKLSPVFASLLGSVDSEYGLPSAVFTAQGITACSDHPERNKADRSAEEHRVCSLMLLSSLFTFEPSLDVFNKNTVHTVMCAPSEQILVCLSSLHFVSAQSRLQQEAYASGLAELAFHGLNTSIRQAQASYAANCLLQRRSASLVTSIVQAPLSLSTPHQTSTPEPWFWTHRSSYLHQAQVPRASADFLWSQTTELASTALSAQTTVLRAFHAKTYAIYEDSITVAQSTRDTADLSSSKG